VHLANREPRTAIREPRRILAFLCLLAIVALRIEPQLLQLPFTNRRTLSAILTRWPDGNWQQYPRFLREVRAHTRSGDSVVIVVPMLKWDDGYSYAYYRASYFLAGREVLPLVTADDRPHPENLRAARYIAGWHMTRQPGLGEVVWEGEGGVLLRH
jgi:hypothetical protein